MVQRAQLRVFRKDGSQVHKGDPIVSFRGDTWQFGGIVHERKLWAYRDEDPNGAPFYPNRATQDFYPSVFDLDIVDVSDEQQKFDEFNRIQDGIAVPSQLYPE